MPERDPVARTIDSPIGPLQLVAEDGALTRIAFPGQHDGALPHGSDPALDTAARQLAEYFAGQRETFALPLQPAGTEFQQRVWAALRAIPFGETRSYAEIASDIGSPASVRAVGAANGRNPLPIVVPCHRVIGSDGSLTGFAGGLDRKETLLRLEGALLL